MIGCVFMGIFGFVYFAMLNTGIPWVIFLAIAISLLPVMTEYGPEAALIAESFTPRLRYSGSFARLPACVDDRRRALAVHRDVAVRNLSFGLADRGVYPDLRRHRHRRDLVADRLHEQGHRG